MLSCFICRAFGTEKRDGYYITLRNVQITDDDLYVCRTSENEWGLDIKTSNSLELEIAGRDLVHAILSPGEVYT